MGAKLRGLLKQILEGLMSLKRDKVLQLLIINTLAARRKSIGSIGSDGPNC